MKPLSFNLSINTNINNFDENRMYFNWAVSPTSFYCLKTFLFIINSINIEFIYYF